MASPHPKPSEKKKLQGTDRKDRVNENRMDPMKVLAVPEPPEELGEVGRKEWNDMLQQLAHLQMLAKVDLSVLKIYCREVETYWNADEDIRDNGYRNKHDQVSPSVSVRNKAFNNILKIADRFGFVASAREKLSMPQQQEKDPLEEHLNKKSG